jgi:hypothetical protein
VVEIVVEFRRSKDGEGGQSVLGFILTSLTTILTFVKHQLLRAMAATTDKNAVPFPVPARISARSPNTYNYSLLYAQKRNRTRRRTRRTGASCQKKGFGVEPCSFIVLTSNNGTEETHPVYDDREIFTLKEGSMLSRDEIECSRPATWSDNDRESVDEDREHARNRCVTAIHSASNRINSFNSNSNRTNSHGRTTAAALNIEARWWQQLKKRPLPSPLSPRSPHSSPLAKAKEQHQQPFSNAISEPVPSSVTFMAIRLQFKEMAQKDQELAALREELRRLKLEYQASTQRCSEVEQENAGLVDVLSEALTLLEQGKTVTTNAPPT